MRRKLRSLAAAAAVVALAAPAGASANQANSGTDCNYAAGQAVSIPVLNNATGQVIVYEGTGSTGNAGTTSAGACVNVPNGLFEGGLVEVGTGAQGAYAVIDGDNNNTAGPSSGYTGVSTYEDGASRAACGADQTGAPGSTNSGGCLGVKGTPVNIPLLPVMCGFTSGPNWNNTTRDGCYVP